MKIVLTETAHRKIMHWVHKADFEVSGMGKVAHDHKTDTFTVLDVYLLKQEGGAAHTDIDATSMAQLMYKTKDLPGLLSFWWHSHVNMSVFWSGQDRTTITELGEQGLCVATVFNKRNEHRSAVCAKMTGLLGERAPWWDEVETTFETSQPPTPEEWDMEFDTNVQRKKYLPPTVLSDAARKISEFDRKAWAREDARSGDTGYTGYSGYDDYIVPYWAQQDAKLLDIGEFTYWNKIQYGNQTQMDELDKQLDLACQKKHGMSYEDWHKTQMMGDT